MFTFHLKDNVKTQKRASSRDTKASVTTMVYVDNTEQIHPKCAFCGVAFSCVDKLVDHVLLRHLHEKRGKNVRSCDSCYACFEEKSALSEHILTAHTRNENAAEKSSI